MMPTDHWPIDHAACTGTDCPHPERDNCLRYQGHLQVLESRDVSVNLRQVYRHRRVVKNRCVGLPSSESKPRPFREQPIRSAGFFTKCSPL